MGSEFCPRCLTRRRDLYVACSACEGSGRDDNDPEGTCRKCDGWAQKLMTVCDCSRRRLLRIPMGQAH